MSERRRRICFVTGTRAEFGLMGAALRAIRGHRKLALQIVATGMHLDPAHGSSIEVIRREGWTVDRVVAWPPRRTQAANVGGAIAGIAGAFAELQPDIVLVVGDRVEAFAAAAAGQLSGRVVAHVHGGDRALGQLDDSLRHAITKLSHLHFPATLRSTTRLKRLGEDAWRIHPVGSPGIDGIVAAASPRRRLAQLYPDLRPRRYALVLLHPTDADQAAEYQRARMLFEAVLGAGFDGVVIVFPNNDPGAAGIIKAWGEAPSLAPVLRGEGRGEGSDAKLRKSRRVSSRPSPQPSPLGTGEREPEVHVEKDLPRADFLGLLRDAAMLIGNSSSGIIEAASFGTRVIDVGDRQAGRECSGNIVNVPFDPAALRRALKRAWNGGEPRVWTGENVYGGRGAGRRMASVLARVDLGMRVRRKLIAY